MNLASENTISSPRIATVVVQDCVHCPWFDYDMNKLHCYKNTGLDLNFVDIDNKIHPMCPLPSV